MRHFALVSVFLLVTGCTSWSRVDPKAPGGQPAFRQYRIWTSDSSLLVRAVRIEHDSLSGVPVNQELACTECRVTVAMSEVDSLTTGKTEGIGAGVLGGAAGAAALLILLLLSLRLSGASFD